MAAFSPDRERLQVGRRRRPPLQALDAQRHVRRAHRVRRADLAEGVRELPLRVGHSVLERLLDEALREVGELGVVQREQKDDRSSAEPYCCPNVADASRKASVPIVDARAMRAIIKPRSPERGPALAGPLRRVLPLLRLRAEHLRVPVVHLEAEGHEGSGVHPAAFFAPRILGVPAPSVHPSLSWLSMTTVFRFLFQRSQCSPPIWNMASVP